MDITDAKGSVHLLHKSFSLLIFQSLVTALVVVLVFLGLQIFIQNSFSYTQPYVSESTIFGAIITIAMLLLVLYAAILAFLVLRWIREFYIIVPGELIIKEGLLVSREEHFPLKGLEEIEVKQGALGKIFNFGDIVVFSGSLRKETALKNIPEPHKAVALLEEFTQ